MTVTIFDDTPLRPSNGERVREFLEKHHSDITAAVSLGFAAHVVYKVAKSVHPASTAGAVVLGGYAGITAFNAALQVGAEVVKRTSENPSDHPIVKFRNALNPMLKPRATPNDLPDNVRSINNLQRKPLLAAL